MQPDDHYVDHLRRHPCRWQPRRSTASSSTPKYRDDFDAWRKKYKNPFKDLKDTDLRIRNWDSDLRDAATSTPTASSAR